MQGYEVACILAAKEILDMDSALQRHTQLLRPYYFDYRQVSDCSSYSVDTMPNNILAQELGDSPKRGEILGLELLSLLVGKKLGDFYCLLEVIPLKEQNDKFIGYVATLEKHLMEVCFVCFAEVCIPLQ